MISHRIDASWNQFWTGTTQARRFKIDGNTLHIETLGQNNSRTGKKTISVLIWTKLK